MADAVSVRMLDVVALAGENDAVTPVGIPLAVKATALEKPFCAFTAILLCADAPGAAVTLAGEVESVKLGGPVMVSVMRAVLVKLPDVPVIVTVAVAAAALAAAVKVSVLDVVALAGANVAVTPAGKPDAASATVPVNPCCGLTVMVLVPLAPGAIESDGADAASPNPAVADVAVSALING